MTKSIESIFYAGANNRSDAEEVEKGKQELFDRLGNILSQEEFFEIEAMINGLQTDAEKQGFIYGFKKATKIFAECKD